MGTTASVLLLLFGVSCCRVDSSIMMLAADKVVDGFVKVTQSIKIVRRQERERARCYLQWVVVDALSL